MTIKLTWEPDGTVTYFSGEITLQALTDLYVQLTSDPRIVSSTYSIYCCEPGARLNFDEDDFNKITELEKAAHVTQRQIVWVVVTKDPLIKEQVGRMYFENPIMICDEISQARDYIKSLLSANVNDLDATQKLAKTIMGLTEANKIKKTLN